ncbi:NAD(P)/FAD-dependent oxidoreductase [Aquimarina agarivorans]|uniref:NAD(P)/FAD-dependent oxidoreductase n=1 Tax=Aquimarina agarivorans TaxID=980584 RepID=UPI000248FD4C|nr:FAD-binding oxidoreductase [Aquimarina agarivorans]
MIDYIIVGFGLGGSVLASHLEGEGKSVYIIDGSDKKASVVAAGLFNPIVLKRYTMSWNGHAQLQYAKLFYENLGCNLKTSIVEEFPVYRRFHSAEEQNNWFEKIDQPELSTYLSPYLVEQPTKAIVAPFKYGQVMKTGRILIQKMLDAYTKQLVNKAAFKNEDFDYDLLEIKKNYVQYKGVKAKRIVFCEGYGIKKNPFFNHLLLVGNKGTYLIIECKDLQLKAAVKSHFFIVPLGNNRYKFGATYEQQIKGGNYDLAAKAHLISCLDDLITVPYKIIDQVTAVRPTVKDRRPLAGSHHKHENVFVMNGLGTRGVMIAPTVAKQMVDFMEYKKPLPNEINCNRYKSKADY